MTGQNDQLRVAFARFEAGGYCRCLWYPAVEFAPAPRFEDNLARQLIFTNS